VRHIPDGASHPVRPIQGKFQGLVLWVLGAGLMNHGCRLSSDIAFFLFVYYYLHGSKRRPSAFTLSYLPDFFSAFLTAFHRNQHFLPHHIETIFDL
jgi:hypothetical protein